MAVARVGRRSALGSGLAIVSKHPIVEVAFHKFTLNGSPIRVLDGDWFVGKGVAYAQLQHPRGRLDLFTTHLIADYSEARQKGRPVADEYRGHRALQIYELMQFVSSRSDPHSLGTIVGGDLNVEMSSVAWRALIDSQRWLRSIFDRLPADRIPCTCNCPLNRYSPANCEPKTIDHILYSHERLRLSRFDLAFTAQLPHSVGGSCRGSGCPVAFSDHFGVSALFNIVEGGRKSDKIAAPAPLPGSQPAERALAQLRSEIADERQRCKGRQWMSLFQGIILLIMLVGTMAVTLFIVATPSVSASPPMYILLALIPVLTLALGLNLVMYFLHYPNERAILGEFLVQM